MVNVILIAKLIVKLLVFILLLPFILIWFIAKYFTYKYALIYNLKRAGMPAEYAIELAREASIGKVFLSKNKARYLN